MSRHSAYIVRADGRLARHPFASFPHAEAARLWLAGHPDSRVRFVPALPEPDRAPVSRYTGHRFDCPTYATLDASDCDCVYSGAEDPDDTEPGHPDYAWEAEYRAHSSSHTGLYEAP